MRRGNLSRASSRSSGVFAFQMMRVFVVVALAASGAFAVSLSMDEQSAQQDIASEPLRESTIVSQSVEQPSQTASVQVVTADPVAIAPMAEETSSDQAAVAEAGPISDAQAPEAVVDTDAPLAPEAPEMTGAVNTASLPDEADPARDLIDLNTASLEQLNTLRDAGSISRAIIKRRPYASVEDLVKRKVIRRSVYEKIKDRVTVR
jgi:DNA uptake protein ComE-like DNA-binding protein